MEMGVKSHEAWLKSEFYHIYVLCAIGVRSRSSFRVTPCRLPWCWCRQNNWSCTEISPFTDCNETHFFCKFWIQSLDMQPFYWFKWYKCLKMAFKMSQEFPTASLDITEDFHILHSAYVYICCSILKAETYNWLPNTHTHTHTHTRARARARVRTTSNNYKQKATGHVTSLANGHFTGSEAPFVTVNCDRLLKGH